MFKLGFSKSEIEKLDILSQSKILKNSGNVSSQGVIDDEDSSSDEQTSGDSNDQSVENHFVLKVSTVCSNQDTG